MKCWPIGKLWFCLFHTSNNYWHVSEDLIKSCWYTYSSYHPKDQVKLSFQFLLNFVLLNLLFLSNILPNTVYEACWCWTHAHFNICTMQDNLDIDDATGVKTAENAQAFRMLCWCDFLFQAVHEIANTDSVWNLIFSISQQF